MTPEVEAFWARFCAVSGVEGPPFDVDRFGDGPEMADELLALILAGTKRATCSLARWHEGEGRRPPRPGDCAVVLDGAGRPACIIETTDVRIGPVSSVDEAFAFEEGEGDRSRAYWLKVHRAFFQSEADEHGFAYSDALPAVFERFCVVWPPEFADPAPRQ